MSTVPRSLLTAGEAAQVLGTSERHVRRLWHERRLPAVKLGKFLRFDPRDLEAFVDRHRIDAGR